MRLSEFNFDLRYRPGVDNQVADAMSRNPLPQELSNEEASSVMFAMYFQRLEAERCTSAHYASDTPTYMVSWGKIVDPEVSMGSGGVCHARTIPTQEAPDDSDCESSGDVGEQDMDHLMALAADTVTLEEIKAAQQPDVYAREVRKSLSGPRKARRDENGFCANACFMRALGV